MLIGKALYIEWFHRNERARMTRKTIPDMKEIFRQAAEIAKQVPENMQESAFNRALDLLTGADSTKKERSSGTTPHTTKNRQVATTADHQSPVERLKSLIDTTQHPRVASADLVLDRALMVLQIAMRDHDIDGLTPSEIAQLLTDKFRLRTSRPAVSMALGPATNLVNRTPWGRGYQYQIMGPGEEYLAQLGSGHESSSQSSNQKARRPKRQPKRPAKGSEPTSNNKTGGGKSTRPGPKKILETLITENFFDSPRDVAQMVDHLQVHYARTYKAKEISAALIRLRREKKLDRSKNDKGNYEYVVHK
jgi:hypothetical protein